MSFAGSRVAVQKWEKRVSARLLSLAPPHDLHVQQSAEVPSHLR
jgi:hypothetical protein